MLRLIDNKRGRYYTKRSEEQRAVSVSGLAMS